jgi:hypothetical protein
LLNTSFTTTTGVTSSPNPALINQSVTFAATISSDRPIPDGEAVTFYNGRTVVGTGATANGVALVNLSFASAKTYTIKAIYPGDIFHKSSSGVAQEVVTY